MCRFARFVLSFAKWTYSTSTIKIYTQCLDNRKQLSNLALKAALQVALKVEGGHTVLPLNVVAIEASVHIDEEESRLIPYTDGTLQNLKMLAPMVNVREQLGQKAEEVLD